MIVEPLCKDENPIILPILKKTGFLASLPEEEYLKVICSLKKVIIKGGESIIRAGDNDRSLYIVIQGRLRVFDENEEQGIADITSGNILGEIGSLIGVKRTRTVRALRDSLLVKIDESIFLELEKIYPNEILKFAKVSLSRLISPKRPVKSGEKVSNLLIIPGADSHLNTFVPDLFEEIKTHKKAVLITFSDFERKFNNPSENEIISWMNDLEEKHDIVVYVGDGTLTPWTERLIRSADRVVIVAKSSVVRDLNDSEEKLFSINKETRPYVDLVIFHPKETTIIEDTHLWLKNRPVNLYHHLQKSNKLHYERLTRFILGKAFGVVLSGGGARGLAHFGVLKALEDLNIPIDFICGNSMGSIIAAGYAAFGLKKSLEINQEFVRKFYQIPTLPLHSFLSGKMEIKLFKSTWDEMRIEDLWMGFFCVASDLAEYKLKVIAEGEIWKALRTSTSIPAIYPPVYTSRGEILVDGGLLNNLPVDKVRERISGGYILAVNCNVMEGKPYHSLPETFTRSGWHYLLQHLNPFKAKTKIHNIVSIIMKSFFAVTIEKQKEMEDLADGVIRFNKLKVGINDYSKSEAIIEEAYLEAKKQLPHLLKMGHELDDF